MERAQIDDENIVLGDIASIDGDDPRLIQKLRRLVVGRAPLAGKSRRIDGNFLRMRLKQNGLEASRVALHVPPKVVITRRFIEISKEKIKMLVSGYLLKNLPAARGEARIRQLRIAEGVRLPGGRVTYQVMPPRNSLLVGKVPLSVIKGTSPK